MYRIALILHVPDDRASLQHALDLLTAENRRFLRDNPGTPDVYSSGVRYRREERDRATGRRVENWRSIPEVLAQRGGDCEDLACYLAAQLQERGEAARALPFPNGAGGWHIKVRRGGGFLEDPSARLGMGMVAA